MGRLGLGGLCPRHTAPAGAGRALYSHMLTEPCKNQLKPVRLLSLLTEQPPEVREHKPLPRSQRQNSRVAIQGPASPPRGAHTHSPTTQAFGEGGPSSPAASALTAGAGGDLKPPHWTGVAAAGQADPKQQIIGTGLEPPPCSSLAVTSGLGFPSVTRIYSTRSQDS